MPEIIVSETIEIGKSREYGNCSERLTKAGFKQYKKLQA